MAEPRAIVLRLARRVASEPTFGLSDGDVLLGQVSGPVPFVENGLGFEADVIKGQKTGHFLDQRDNRLRVRELAAGRRVLDVFCCTGGFSVNAAAGGAESVHSVDLSRHAIEATRHNLDRNSVVTANTHCTSEVGDAFEVMAELRRQRKQYDLVVVDPPSFAQRQADVARALRAYRRLTSLALPLVAPGGTLVQASCSARIAADDLADLVIGQADRDGYRLTEISETGHAIDHPVSFAEGAYLKAIFATVAGHA